MTFALSSLDPNKCRVHSRFHDHIAELTYEPLVVVLDVVPVQIACFPSQSSPTSLTLEFNDFFYSNQMTNLVYHAPNDRTVIPFHHLMQALKT